MRNTLNQVSRRKINGRLNNTVNYTYHESIPMSLIVEALGTQGTWMIQEDETPWSGVICGTNGVATFRIANERGEITNCRVFMSWYKMSSGNYEIIAYVS